MIILRLVEPHRRHDLVSTPLGRTPLAASFLLVRPGDRAVVVVMEDRRSGAARADVVGTCRFGVVASCVFQKDFEQRVVRDDLRVVGDVDRPAWPVVSRNNFCIPDSRPCRRWLRETTASTPFSCWNTASVHQKQPAANVAFALPGGASDGYAPRKKDFAVVDGCCGLVEQPIADNIAISPTRNPVAAYRSLHFHLGVSCLVGERKSENVNRRVPRAR